VTLLMEEIEYNKRVYGRACDLCQEFIILDKDSPNYEGQKMYKRDHEYRDNYVKRLVVCENCIDVQPCKANLDGVHPGPVVELDEDMASHYFDSNSLWYYLYRTATERTRYALCPGCQEVLYWSVNMQRFTDLDITAVGVTLHDLSGKFDLDMTRVPMGIMSPIDPYREAQSEDPR
jgi:hypothetical protein